MIRRVVEAGLPWYDPQREADKDERVREHAQEARRLALALHNTNRALRHVRR